VPLQVVILSLERFVCAHHLRFKRFNLRWKQSVKAERGAFLNGEGGAFVQAVTIQEIETARNTRTCKWRWLCRHEFPST
jgi:hypothetical protein